VKRVDLLSKVIGGAGRQKGKEGNLCFSGIGKLGTIRGEKKASLSPLRKKERPGGCGLLFYSHRTKGKKKGKKKNPFLAFERVAPAPRRGAAYYRVPSVEGGKKMDTIRRVRERRI